MKVSEDEERDKYGEYPCCWVSGKDVTPQKLHEWLFNHCHGYKFAIIFDCTGDEFEEPEKKTPVYFLDTVFDELVEYSGIDEVKKWLENKA